MKRSMHGARLAQFAMFALTSVALAAGAPDFSGQWKLNAAKSTNLGMMAAVQQTVSITQSPAEMKLVEASDFQGQKSGRTLRYDLKGAPVMNEGGMGGQALSGGIGGLAFALACNSYNEATVAMGCSIDYVAAARLGDTLNAECIEQSRSYGADALLRRSFCPACARELHRTRRGEDRNG